MEQNGITRELLMGHYQTYPKLQAQDIFKFLYQSAFGCEHLVSSSGRAAALIEEEYGGMHNQSAAEIELLDGNYCRVSLSYMDKGISAETFGKLFAASAKQEKSGLTALVQKLQVAKDLVREGRLPFPAEEFDRAVDCWEANGYNAVRHSEIFRENYCPAYRVIDKQFIPFLPLFAELDRRLAKGKVTLAIEGGSASGKTTFSQLLESVYDCTVFHMDDFFLQRHQRTAERFKQIGGNIDWERFLAEVLCPLEKGETIGFRKFDCASMTLTEAQQISPKKLVVVEGAYAMHPKLAAHYDFSVFLHISPQLQRERILRRNSPQLAQRFFDEWIPLERVYFTETQVDRRCDMVIPVLQDSV